MPIDKECPPNYATIQNGKINMHGFILQLLQSGAEIGDLLPGYPSETAQQ